MLVLPSFAKINWILKILGKRDDGYHELFTVFQAVDLCDRLTFEPGHEGVVLQVEGWPAPADSSNLVLRAAALLQPSARRRPAANILLEKRIPLGAGLGGGSSNAAITLLALNQLWDCRLKRPELSALAARLGSDVAFFLQGGLAAGWGRGELLRALPGLPFDSPLLLLYPGIEIPAARAYSLGAWGPCKAPSLLTSEALETRIHRFCQAGKARKGLWAVLENDFEALLYRHYPALRRARESLLEAGCAATLISGSGSSLIGLARPGRVREMGCSAEFSQQYCLFQANPLSRREYWRRLSGGGLQRGWQAEENP